MDGNYIWTVIFITERPLAALAQECTPIAWHNEISLAEA
jgi:hypothetical protein